MGVYSLSLSLSLSLYLNIRTHIYLWVQEVNPCKRRARLQTLRPYLRKQSGENTGGGSDRRRYIHIYMYTDSSSDSASHTHSARRPSAAALLTRSRGGGFTPPPSHTPTLRHTLSPTGLQWASTLSLSPSLSLTRCWGAGSSSLADVEKRKNER